MSNENPRGVDLSHFNVDPEFHALANAGIAFVYLKATQGVGFVDATYTDRRKRAQSVGLRVGSYHFFDADSSGLEQAEHFLSVVGTLSPGELPPALDLESTPGWDALPIETRSAEVGAWLQRTESVLGVRPMIYASPGWWEDTFGAADFSGHPLWLAHYGPEPGSTGLWKSWAVWQYGEFGTVSGAGVGNVDTDQWNGALPPVRSGS